MLFRSGLVQLSSTCLPALSATATWQASRPSAQRRGFCRARPQRGRITHPMITFPLTESPLVQFGGKLPASSTEGELRCDKFPACRCLQATSKPPNWPSAILWRNHTNTLCTDVNGSKQPLDWHHPPKSSPCLPHLHRLVIASRGNAPAIG